MKRIKYLAIFGLIFIVGNFLKADSSSPLVQILPGLKTKDSAVQRLRAKLQTIISKKDFSGLQSILHPQMFSSFDNLREGQRSS
jgi:hypothetical protein